jgi:hypothetical protein
MFFWRNLLSSILQLIENYSVYDDELIILDIRENLVSPLIKDILLPKQIIVHQSIDLPKKNV